AAQHLPGLQAFDPEACPGTVQHGGRAGAADGAGEEGERGGDAGAGHGRTPAGWGGTWPPGAAPREAAPGRRTGQKSCEDRSRTPLGSATSESALTESLGDAYQEADRDRDSLLLRDLVHPVVFVAGGVVDPTARCSARSRPARSSTGRCGRCARGAAVAGG